MKWHPRSAASHLRSSFHPPFCSAVRWPVGHLAALFLLAVFANPAPATVMIGDMVFDDNAFGDVVLSATPSGSGHFNEESSPPNINNPLTLPEDFAILEAIVLGSDMTRWVSLRTTEARLTIGFTDLLPVDGPGDDIAIFEIGATAPISVTIGGNTQLFTSEPHGSLNMVLIDLEDFGVSETSAVTLGGTNIFNDIAGVAAINFVPEPSSFFLAGVGLIGLVAWGWRRRKRPLVGVCFVLLVSAGTASHSYGTILVGGDPTGLLVEGFSGVANGSYSTLARPFGITFGEKLVGQVQTAVDLGGPSGPFDEITGVPSLPLMIDSSVAADVGVGTFAGGLVGLGESGWPDPEAIGEGSIAVLYPVDQMVFGFRVINEDIDSIDIQFYDRSANLLADLTVEGPHGGQFMFTSTGAGVAAIVIDLTGANTGGGQFDDFLFTPEPPAATLAGIGLIGLAAFGWRRRKR